MRGGRGVPRKLVCIWEEDGERRVWGLSVDGVVQKLGLPSSERPLVLDWGLLRSRGGVESESGTLVCGTVWPSVASAPGSRALVGVTAEGVVFVARWVSGRGGDRIVVQSEVYEGVGSVYAVEVSMDGRAVLLRRDGDCLLLALQRDGSGFPCGLPRGGHGVVIPSRVYFDPTSSPNLLELTKSSNGKELTLWRWEVGMTVPFSARRTSHTSIPLLEGGWEWVGSGRGESRAGREAEVVETLQRIGVWDEGREGRESGGMWGSVRGMSGFKGKERDVMVGRRVKVRFVSEEGVVEVCGGWGLEEDGESGVVVRRRVDDMVLEREGEQEDEDGGGEGGSSALQELHRLTLPNYYALRVRFNKTDSIVFDFSSGKERRLWEEEFEQWQQRASRVMVKGGGKGERETSGRRWEVGSWSVGGVCEEESGKVVGVVMGVVVEESERGGFVMLVKVLHGGKVGCCGVVVPRGERVEEVVVGSTSDTIHCVMRSGSVWWFDAGGNWRREGTERHWHITSSPSSLPPPFLPISRKAAAIALHDHVASAPMVIAPISTPTLSTHHLSDSGEHDGGDDGSGVGGVVDGGSDLGGSLHLPPPSLSTPSPFLTTEPAPTPKPLLQLLMDPTGPLVYMRVGIDGHLGALDLFPYTPLPSPASLIQDALDCNDFPAAFSLLLSNHHPSIPPTTTPPGLSSILTVLLSKPLHPPPLTPPSLPTLSSLLSSTPHLLATLLQPHPTLLLLTLLSYQPTPAPLLFPATKAAAQRCIRALVAASAAGQARLLARHTHLPLPPTLSHDPVQDAVLLRRKEKTSAVG